MAIQKSSSVDYSKFTWGTKTEVSQLSYTDVYGIYVWFSKTGTKDGYYFAMQEWVANAVYEEAMVKKYDLISARSGEYGYTITVQTDDADNGTFTIESGFHDMEFLSFSVNSWLKTYKKASKTKYGRYGFQGEVVLAAGNGTTGGKDPDDTSSATNTPTSSAAKTTTDTSSDTTYHAAVSVKEEDAKYAASKQIDTTHGTDLTSSRDAANDSKRTGVTIQEYIEGALGPVISKACFAEDKTPSSSSTTTTTPSSGGSTTTPSSGGSTTPSGGSSTDTPSGGGGSETPSSGGSTETPTDTPSETPSSETPTTTTATEKEVDQELVSISRIENYVDTSITRIEYADYKVTNIKNARDTLLDTIEKKYANVDKEKAASGGVDVNNLLKIMKEEINEYYNVYIKCVNKKYNANVKKENTGHLYVMYMKPNKSSANAATNGFIIPVSYALPPSKSYEISNASHYFVKDIEKNFAITIPNDEYSVAQYKKYIQEGIDKAEALAGEAIGTRPELDKQQCISDIKAFYSKILELVSALTANQSITLAVVVDGDKVQIGTAYAEKKDQPSSGSSSADNKTSTDSSSDANIKPVPPSIIMAMAIAITGDGSDVSKMGKYNLFRLPYDSTLTSQAEDSGLCAFNDLNEAISGHLKWCHKQTNADSQLGFSIEKDTLTAKETTMLNYLKNLNNKDAQKIFQDAKNAMTTYNLTEWDSRAKAENSKTSESVLSKLLAAAAKLQELVNKIGVGVVRKVIGTDDHGVWLILEKLPLKKTNPCEPVYPDYVTVADNVPAWIVTQAEAEELAALEQKTYEEAGITDKQAANEAAIRTLESEMDEFADGQFHKWAQANGKDISDEKTLAEAKKEYNQLAARNAAGFQNGIYLPDAESQAKWSEYQIQLRSLRQTSTALAAVQDAWQSDTTTAANYIYSKEKDWNQNKGAKVELVDESSSDLLSGNGASGASSSSSSTSQLTGNAGQVVEGACKWAVEAAKDESHGYSQPARTKPDMDCTSFVSYAYKEGGGVTQLFDTYPPGGDDFQNPWIKIGFQYLDFPGESGLKRGDIVVNNHHVELFLGGGRLVGAHSDRGNPQTGDQTGTEISEINYYPGSPAWDHIVRYPETASSANQTEGDRTPPSGDGETGWEATIYHPDGSEMEGAWGASWLGENTLAGRTVNSHYLAVACANSKGGTQTGQGTEIAYGEVVYLQFDNSGMADYNGEYVAIDTGSATYFYKGAKHVDLFIGDGRLGSTMELKKKIAQYCTGTRFGGIPFTLKRTGKKISKSEALNWRSPK